MISWGIWGLGAIAGRFASDLAYLPDARLTAVASRASERAEAFARKQEVPRHYVGREDLANDLDIDVVYVATPHAMHYDDVQLFLAAGKHVLCEKPLALNARHAGAAIELARSRGLFLMEALWSRFLPAYVALRDLLAEAVVGEPLVVEADFGFRAPPAPEHRLWDPALGGGALLDLGIYPLNVCTTVLGAPKGIRAAAAMASVGVDQQVAALLEYDNGSIGLMKASLVTELSNTARISATDGSIALPAFMHGPNRLTVTTRGREETQPHPFTGIGLHYQVAEVHTCLAEGRQESTVMPWADTLLLAGCMDTIREQIGLRYPGE